MANVLYYPEFRVPEMFKRPSVAGTILQTPQNSLIIKVGICVILFLQIFKTPLIQNPMSIGSEILR